jgi:hypothetical protein
LGPTPVCVSFEIQARWLIASIPQTGWIETLDVRHRKILRNAIVGLFKFSGVDLLSEQVKSAFEPQTVTWDIRGEQLVVRADSEGEVVYELESNPMEPTAERHVAMDLPTLHQADFMFSRQRVLWSTWLETWDQKNLDDVPALLEATPVVPWSESQMAAHA